MCAAARVVLNSDDVVHAPGLPVKVQRAYALPVPTTSVSDGDVAVGVAATLFALGDGEGAQGAARVDVGVERTAEVAEAGGDGFVGFVDVFCAGEGGFKFGILCVFPDCGHIGGLLLVKG